MMNWLRQLARLPIAMLAPVLLLCAVGYLTIRTDDPARAQQQAVFVLAGVIVMIAAAAVPYRIFGELSYPLFVLSLVLLVLIFVLPASIVPMPEGRGARRWFRVGGVNIQASEIAKLSYILMLAWYLRYRKNYRRLLGLLWPFALTLAPLALVLKEPDLGTALLFLPILFAMLYLAGAKGRHLLVVVLLGAACIPAFWPRLEDHQKVRVRVWLCQGQAADDPVLHDQGYQLRQSLTALGSGGLTGLGLADSIFHRYDNMLPEDDTDFIFALIGHQWGLLGCAAVLAAYLLIVVCGVEIAAATAEPFGRLLAVGVTSLFAAQMAVNTGVAMGLLPITGMTLPFVSYGGSSLLINFACLGLLLNVRQRRPIILARRRFQWDADEEELT